MASLEEIRRHVLDDAVQLTRATGVATPLFNAFLQPPGHRVARYLRFELLATIILIVVRMYDPPDKPSKKPNARPRTGDTASIPTILEAAVKERKVEPNEAAVWKARAEKLQKTMGDHGVTFEELRAYRHAELAHSLHRGDLKSLASWPVWDFVHETVELVFEIDQALVKAGMPPPSVKFAREFDDWRDLGIAFWKRHDLDFPDNSTQPSPSAFSSASE